LNLRRFRGAAVIDRLGGGGGLTLHVLRASNVEEIGAIFGRLRELQAGALALATDPFLFGPAIG
jgi:hypothetical protein